MMSHIGRMWSYRGVVVCLGCLEACFPHWDTCPIMGQHRLNSLFVRRYLTYFI